MFKEEKFWLSYSQKYLKITLFLEKRTLERQHLTTLHEFLLDYSIDEALSNNSDELQLLTFFHKELYLGGCRSSRSTHAKGKKSRTEDMVSSHC